MASRILGMGDMLSLVEEAQRQGRPRGGEKLAEKVKKGKGFDLEDFKQQIVQMKKMGGMASLLDKLPAQLAADGAGRSAGRAADAPHRGHHQLDDAEGARQPELIKASRKRRIATGAGVSVQEVNRLLNQFEQMQKMMKMMKGGNRESAADPTSSAPRTPSSSWPR
jgi:signal recognition particle subunit SRP54